jgi:PhoPQ-activated pathogenicity-related protein
VIFSLFYSIVVINSAWTTAAVDNERVIGAVPIVMDILNIHQVKNKLINLIK